MINYKQILEAVNRGIKFALDDFDDNEQIQGQINSKVNNTSNLKEYLEWQKLILFLLIYCNKKFYIPSPAHKALLTSCVLNEKQLNSYVHHTFIVIAI